MATVLPKSMCGSPLGRCGGPLPIPSPGGSIPRSGRDAAMTRTALALEPADASASEAGDLTERVRTLVTAEWTPLVNAIDKGELYPADILRKLGGIGAWAAHLPADGVADLRPAIAAMAAIGECCGATSFMAWCQNTLAWYVGNTDNAALKARLLDRVASGAMLGGTGLSNPMKSFFAIYTLNLNPQNVQYASLFLTTL